MENYLSFIALAFAGALGVVSMTASSGRSRIHFPPVPARVRPKQPKGSHGDTESLQALVESWCPSLFTPFKPLWWLFNGHLQTIYCVLGDFTTTNRLQYSRRYIRLADEGTLGLDFAPADGSKARADAPIIVVKHGLTGGSYEAYVRAILVSACTPVEEGGLGYRAVVVNFRGCAGVPITCPQLYSAGHTDDLRQALMFISHLYPDAPLLGLGFSLGANVMTRYIAEEGRRSRLYSGCALACPWDLEDNNNGLLRSFLGTHIYQKGMGGNLQNLAKRHEKSLTADPEHRVAKAYAKLSTLKNPTLAQFDDAFTRVAGGASPPFPFPTVDDYYRWGSSHHVVKDIKVPFLAINASDDPVVRRIPMDGADNEFVVMVATSGGGHLGWFQSGSDPRADRWVTKPVLEWMRLTGEYMEGVSNDIPRTYIDDEGYLREEGRTHLGCKELPGGGLIDGNVGEAGILHGL